MNSNSKLNKIKRTRINVLINKAFKKAYTPYKRKFQRSEDQKIPSYSQKTFDLANFEFPFLFNLNFIKNNAENIIKSANHSLNHEFRLFTKDHRKLNYKIKPNGREKYKYEYDFSYIKALENINEANKDYSNYLRSTITGDYDPIDWQLDWVSGYRWSESLWFEDIKYGYNKGADVKQPWELGRMQDLPQLGFAFTITNEDQYLNEFKNRILDFYSLNPPRFGVQWKSSMDVSIRAINSIVAFNIFRTSKVKFDKDFSDIFSSFIYDHIIHVYKNIEFSEGQRGNHYLTNICSLIILCSLIKESQVQSILKRSLKSLIRELKYQFNNDGSNFESSIPYHLLTCELVNVAFLYIKNNNDLLNFNLYEETEKKVKSINKFLIQNLHQRYLPRIGDDDSGKFLDLFPFIHRHYNSLNSCLDITLGENSLRSQQELYNSFNKLKKHGVISFKDFGVCIYRNKNYECSFSYSQLGQKGKGGHDHNDRLSFVLSVNGYPVIIDPGTYNYTGIWKRRNEFRSVNYHNTLVVDTQEQNIWEKSSLDDLFWMQNDKARPILLKNRDNEIEAYHSGYTYPHIRKLKYSTNKISGIDKYNSDSIKRILFHLYPSLEIVKIEKGFTIISKKFKIELTSNDGDCTLEKYLYSPVYGTCKESKRIVLTSTKQTINWEIKILEH